MHRLWHNHIVLEAEINNEHPSEEFEYVRDMIMTEFLPYFESYFGRSPAEYIGNHPHLFGFVEDLLSEVLGVEFRLKSFDDIFNH